MLDNNLLRRILQAREDWEQRIEELANVLTGSMGFALFRQGESTRSFIGCGRDGLSQKVIIDFADRKVSIQLLDQTSRCVSQCVVTTHYECYDYFTAQVIALIKANQ